MAQPKTKHTDETKSYAISLTYSCSVLNPATSLPPESPQKFSEFFSYKIDMTKNEPFKPLRSVQFSVFNSIHMKSCSPALSHVDEGSSYFVAVELSLCLHARTPHYPPHRQWCVFSQHRKGSHSRDAVIPASRVQAGICLILCFHHKILNGKLNKTRKQIFVYISPPTFWKTCINKAQYHQPLRESNWKEVWTDDAGS